MEFTAISVGRGKVANGELGKSRHGEVGDVADFPVSCRGRHGGIMEFGLKLP